MMMSLALGKLLCCQLGQCRGEWIGLIHSGPQAGMPSAGPGAASGRSQTRTHESGQGAVTAITSMAQSPAGGEDSSVGPGRHLAAARALPPQGAAGTLSNARTRNSGCAPCHWQAGSGSGSLVRPVSGGPGVAAALRGDGGKTAMYVPLCPPR
jgi:hypothetical protein